MPLPSSADTPQTELHVAGQAISAIAAQVGTTPFYAYDSQAIQQRIETLRRCLPEGIKINYALKANPFLQLVQAISPLVDGLDIASAGELAIACQASPKHISFAGPGKRPEELQAGLAARVLFNVESFHELAQLTALSQKTGIPARIAIRINPDFELKSAGMKMGGGPKPFGVDAEKVPEMLQLIQNQFVQFEGFHLYAGSQNLKGESIAEAQRASYALIKQLAQQSPVPLRHINLGGGFGIPYFKGEQTLDLTPINEALREISEDARQHFPEAAIHLELGRYLVGEAGYYLTRVIDKKESRGHTFLIVDGGMHHHLAASGNFGQVIRKNYPIANALRLNQIGKGPEISIAGPLCTPLDRLGENLSIGPCEIGDLIVIYQSGAYGANSSPQQFLGHPAPVEVLI